MLQKKQADDRDEWKQLKEQAAQQRTELMRKETEVRVLEQKVTELTWAQL
jgi:hypothetical protein